MSHMKNVIITLVDALTDRDAYLDEDAYNVIADVAYLEDIAEAAAALVDALIAPQERCNEGNHPYCCDYRTYAAEDPETITEADIDTAAEIAEDDEDAIHNYNEANDENIDVYAKWAFS